MRKRGLCMTYISTEEAAKKWGISQRRVQILLSQNRIEGAKKCGGRWIIPSDAEKPSSTEKSGEIYTYGLISAVIPMEYNKPEAALNKLEDCVAKMVYLGELEYLRGNYKTSIDIFKKVPDEHKAKTGSYVLALIAYMSDGDYNAYIDIEKSIDKWINGDDSKKKLMGEICLSTAAVGCYAPEVAADWVKRGDFSELTQEMLPISMYLYIKYLQVSGQYEAVLGASKLALAFRKDTNGFTQFDIYIRLLCAAAYEALGEHNEADRVFKEALELTMPYGFIMPFAESTLMLGELLERVLKAEYPEEYIKIHKLWSDIWKNWTLFHNRFTDNHITMILSLREYRIALMLANGKSYSEVAERFNITVGRVKNVISDIYGKLYINSKKELKSHILGVYDD